MLEYERIVCALCQGTGGAALQFEALKPLPSGLIGPVELLRVDP